MTPRKCTSSHHAGRCFVYSISIRSDITPIGCGTNRRGRLLAGTALVFVSAESIVMPVALLNLRDACRPCIFYDHVIGRPFSPANNEVSLKPQIHKAALQDAIWALRVRPERTITWSATGGSNLAIKGASEEVVGHYKVLDFVVSRTED